VLTVGRFTREGATTTTVTQSYALDSTGTPIQAFSIDGIVDLALFGYLVGMVWRRGRTLGARVAGFRVIDVEHPDTSGVPMRKTIIRYLAIFIGTVPAFAVLIYRSVIAGGNADAMFTAGAFRWFIGAAIVAILWVLVLIVQIAGKADPIYDRLAGTAALRTGSEAPR
jgi:RDD family